jgi:hypothetical protein
MSIVHLEPGKGREESDGHREVEAEFVEAVRRRSAESLERAYGFLQAQADPWALLRAEVLCEGRPASDLTTALVEIQEPDGSLPIGRLVAGGAAGFPPVDPEGLTSVETKIVGTLEGLLQAGDAKILNRDWVEGAARFYESVQSADGAFRVAILGSAAEQAQAEIFWTGMIGGILGRTPFSRPSLLEGAGEFIAKRFDPEAVEHDGYAALLACSHFFTNVAHDLSDEALQWCGRALEKGFRSRHLDAVATVRVLLTCDAQAMPGASFDVVELLSQLLEEQAGDGGFAELSLGGPVTRTTQTFDAMLGIVRLCAALEV